MPLIVRRYNEATGVANTNSSGYHEAITLASIQAARAILAAPPPTEPLHELMASPLGSSRWPLAYWSEDRLFSAETRRHWVEPDIGSMPARIA